MELFSIEYSLLAVQNALLGVITEQLRAVVVNFLLDERTLYIRFYYEGEASEELLDLWECAITEASADLGIHSLLDNKIERLDSPQEIPCSGRFAYYRSEKMKEFSMGYALLAVQDALLKVATMQLRAVMVDVSQENRLLYIRFYYDGALALDRLDLWQHAIAKAKADLDPDCSIDSGIERLDFPQKIPLKGRCAYLRKE